MACGRTSKSRWTSSWDESCALNARLFDLDLLEFEGQVVVNIKGQALAEARERPWLKLNLAREQQHE